MPATHLSPGPPARQARPAPAPAVRPGLVPTAVTALVVFGPLAGTAVAAVMLFRGEATVANLAVAALLYAVSGHGLTAGFHRMCTHRAFRARRATKIALAVAGSLAFEGSVLSWATNHRLHHAYTDVPGDPHSPHLSGSSVANQLKGAVHAHVGWLFAPPAQDQDRWVPDLRADRDLVRVDRLFPLWCLVSLAVPTGVGFALTGTSGGAVGGLVWGGLVRVFLLQQATFAVNSACHLWGKRPFATRADDQARNLAFLAVLAMGESWHNLHHSLPRLARHGVGRREWDSTARLIRVLERAGLVSDVRWPDPAVLAARRRVAEVAGS